MAVSPDNIHLSIVDRIIAEITTSAPGSHPLHAMTISDGYDLLGAMRDAGIFGGIPSATDPFGDDTDARIGVIEHLLDTAAAWTTNPDNGSDEHADRLVDAAALLLWNARTEAALATSAHDTSPMRPPTVAESQPITLANLRESDESPILIELAAAYLKRARLDDTCPIPGTVFALFTALINAVQPWEDPDEQLGAVDDLQFFVAIIANAATELESLIP